MADRGMRDVMRIIAGELSTRRQLTGGPTRAIALVQDTVRLPLINEFRRRPDRYERF